MLACINKEDEMMTSYDLLRKICPDMPEEDLVEPTPENNPNYVFSNSIDMNSSFSKMETKEINDKISKEKEDEIALITGKKVRK